MFVSDGRITKAAMNGYVDVAAFADTVIMEPQ
jgi:hypothetical protein